MFLKTSRSVFPLLLFGATLTLTWPVSAFPGQKSTAPNQRQKPGNQQSDNQKARESYQKGKEHFEAGRFEQAMDFFRKAYNSSNKPNLLFNLAITAERLGDFERAVAFYEVYLEELPEAEDAEKVKRRITELRKGQSPDGADEKSPSVPGIPGEQQPAPEKTPEVGRAAEPIPPEGVFEPKSDLEDYYGLDEPEPKKQIFWPGVALGAGGLLIAGGTITGILAYKEYRTLKNGCSPDCENSAVDRARNLAIATDVLLIVGTAGAVTGGVLWILRKRSQRKHAAEKLQSIRLIPAPSPGGVFWLLQGRF